MPWLRYAVGIHLTRLQSRGINKQQSCVNVDMEVAYVAAVAITVPVFPRRMPPTTYSAKEHETSHV